MRLRPALLSAPLLLIAGCSSDSRDTGISDNGPVLLDGGGDGIAATDTGTDDASNSDVRVERPDTTDVNDTPDIVGDAAEDASADTTDCSDDNPCGAGFACVDAACVPTDCEPDAALCTSDGDLVRCINGEFRTIPCADGSTCEESDDGPRCTLPDCTPNAVGCADAFAAFVCDGQGTERFILPCNDDQYCIDGVCRAQQCTPAQAFCEGDVAQICDATGAELRSENCTEGCPEGLQCACVNGRCQQTLCTPDSSRCDGNTRVRCNGAGDSETRTACGEDICIAGDCVESSCTALATECIGDTLSICNESGTARSTEDCTASGAFCRDGACVPQVCTPDSSVCIDIDTRNVCDARGTGRSPADCPTGTFCSTGSCVPSICEPGETRCSGARLQTCDSVGSGYTSSTCPAGQECRITDGTPQCTSLVCSPGEAQCAAGTNERLICNADRTGFDAIACGSSQVCSDGSCIERVCTPGDTRCSGTNVESCVDDGLRWQLSTCTGGQVCSVTGGVATCGSQACTPGSPAICRTGDVQVCNSTGTGYNLVTDCPYGCRDARCSSNRFGGVCSVSADCTAGLYCASGRCIPNDSIYVPAGRTDIGTDRTDSWVSGLERPRHTLSRNQNIIVEKYEVTQQQWTAILPTNPSFFTGCGSDCPVESVSLFDIIYYLNQRSLEDGLTPCYTMTGCSGTPGTGCASAGSPPPTFCNGSYVCDSVTTVLLCDGHRLPTNAEWETAAGTNGSDFPGGINNVPGTAVCADVPALSTYAQYCANSEVTYTPCTDLSGSTGPECAGPAPVGSYSPLPSGLYDALGNVYEWVWDNDDAYPFSLTAEPVVRTLRSTDFGIRRGGGWWSFVTNTRLTQRERTTLTTRSNLNGFRIARTIFAATCYNGVRDAGETGIDCGSPSCSDCPPD